MYHNQFQNLSISPKKGNEVAPLNSSEKRMTLKLYYLQPIKKMNYYQL